jgi:multidrug resistance efflux pump
MESKPNQTREMLPARLEVIPTPNGTRWREFRIRYIPVAIFSLTLVAIWQLWSLLPPTSGVRGIGDGAVSTVTSPQDGFMEQVVVPPYGWVEAGQPIVTIMPFDPGARLDIFQSQVQISRLALEPSITDRNALNYEQLRVESLRLKQELAMAQANLRYAEKVLPRHEALLKERLISEDVYDLTLRDRDFYQAEVREKGQAIEEIDARLEDLSGMSLPKGTGGNSVTEVIIPMLEAQMEAVLTNWNPVTLHAPISGEVVFLRQAREFVRAGEPILMINAPRAERIIAYLKQPIPFEPEVGMPVEVITRSMNPQRFMTQIAQVGARVEAITNALAYVATGALVDTGLPLILPVPQDVQIRPGELVEVLWRRTGTNTTLAQRLFGE